MAERFSTSSDPPIKGIAFVFIINLKFFVTEKHFISNIISSLQGWGVMQNHLVSLLTTHIVSFWILAHVVIPSAWFVSEGHARYVVDSVFEESFSAFRNKLAFVINHFLFFCRVATTDVCCLNKWRMQKAWISLHLQKRAVINKKCVGTTLYPFGPRFPTPGCIFVHVMPFVAVQIFDCLL